MALKINKEGYNIYLIDDFSGDKLENIMEFIKVPWKTKILCKIYVMWQ